MKHVRLNLDNAHGSEYCKFPITIDIGVVRRLEKIIAEVRSKMCSTYPLEPERGIHSHDRWRTMEEAKAQWVKSAYGSLPESRIQLSGVRSYLDQPRAEGATVCSQMVKLDGRRLIFRPRRFPFPEMNEKFPLEMCQEFHVFLLLMSSDDFQFVSEKGFELFLQAKTTKKGLENVNTYFYQKI